MEKLSGFLLLIIIISILSIIYIYFYNRFQRYLMKINEVESRIDITLRERFDLLCKAADFIKSKSDEIIMTKLDDLKNQNLSSFDFERELVSMTREFQNIKITNRNLIKMSDFTTLDFSLNENEAELSGYILYYNDNIANFNKLVRMFPSNIVAKLSRFKEKNYYDGKDLNDDDINDFKL